MKNFAKFKRMHLQWRHCLSKAAGLAGNFTDERPPLWVISSEFCEILEKNYSKEHLRICSKGEYRAA